MSLVYIIASSPFGPVRIETAADMGTLLRTITAQPAHVEDVGTLDAGRVAAVAREALPPAGVGGWIDARPDAAIRGVREARGRVSAMVVAGKGADAAPGPALAADGNATAMAVDAFSEALKRGKDGAACATPIRRRSPADVDVRAIRAGTRMTQAGFASAYGFPVGTVRDWEQGRSVPDKAARTLLLVINCRPEAVREALGAVRVDRS